MNEIKLKLDFLKRILTGTVADQNVVQKFFKTKQFPIDGIMQSVLKIPPSNKRFLGQDWPTDAHTMIGIDRLDNIEYCLNYIRQHEIPGDIMETGVWKGGALIFAKMYCKLYGLRKKIIVADSFAGLPPPEVIQDSRCTWHTQKQLAVSLEEVQNNFDLYGCLEDDVIFLKGWFKDTLPGNALVKRLCLLRLDGDMYKSTMDVMESCYDKVVDHGYIIVDDYGLVECRQAIEDYRKANLINDILHKKHGIYAFWQKSNIRLKMI